jgi:hypothetical protein
MKDIIPQPPPGEQVSRYPLSWGVAGGLLWSAVRLRQRSFARDARQAVAGLDPPLEVIGGDS